MPMFVCVGVLHISFPQPCPHNVYPWWSLSTTDCATSSVKVLANSPSFSEHIHSVAKYIFVFFVTVFLNLVNAKYCSNFALFLSWNSSRQGRVSWSNTKRSLSCHCRGGSTYLAASVICFTQNNWISRGQYWGSRPGNLPLPPFFFFIVILDFCISILGGGGTILLVSMLLSAHVERFGGKLEAELFKL